MDWIPPMPPMWFAWMCFNIGIALYVLFRNRTVQRIGLAWMLYAVMLLVLITSCAPTPTPGTMPVAVEPEPNVPPSIGGASTNLLLFNMQPGYYVAFADSDTVPFAWGWLPAPGEARNPNHPTQRMIDAFWAKRARLQGTVYPKHAARPSPYIGLELHQFTGAPEVPTGARVRIERLR